jgi:hypothetical protein
VRNSKSGVFDESASTRAVEIHHPDVDWVMDRDLALAFWNSSSAARRKGRPLVASKPDKGYFARHSTIASNVGLGTQLSSFLGAASVTGFGKEMEASGCTEACCREQPDKRVQTNTTKRIQIFRQRLQNPLSKIPRKKLSGEGAENERSTTSTALLPCLNGPGPTWD